MPSRRGIATYSAFSPRADADGERRLAVGCVTDFSVRLSASCDGSTVATRSCATTRVYLRGGLRVAVELAIGAPQDVRFVEGIFVDTERNDIEHDSAYSPHLPGETSEITCGEVEGDGTAEDCYIGEVLKYGSAQTDLTLLGRDMQAREEGWMGSQCLANSSAICSHDGTKAGEVPMCYIGDGSDDQIFSVDVLREHCFDDQVVQQCKDLRACEQKVVKSRCDVGAPSRSASSASSVAGTERAETTRRTSGSRERADRLHQMGGCFRGRGRGLRHVTCWCSFAPCC